MKVSRAAVFEPDPSERKRLVSSLEKAGLKVSLVGQAADLGKEQLVVLGPGVTQGPAVARQVREARPEALVLVTARPGRKLTFADGVLPLPISPADLKVRLPELTRLQALERAASKPRAGEGILDPDTQFYTFAHFKEVLFVEVKRAKRHGFPLALAMVAFDERPGAKPPLALRERLLGGLAVAVRRSLRDTDYPVQQGPERILLLMPHTDLSGAMAVCQRITERVATAKVSHGATVIHPTVSVGVASIPPGRELSFAELARNASLSLESARSAGGNRVEFFDPVVQAPELAQRPRLASVPPD